MTEGEKARDTKRAGQPHGKPRILARGVDKMTRSEWLAIRQQGIGGSDAAAICGENPYRSALAVWLSKVSQPTAEEQDSERLEWGVELEEPIARHFSRKQSMPIRRSNLVLQHPEHDFMIANVDRLVNDPGEAGWGVLEVKNVGEYSKSQWDDGNVPPYYLLQGQHYLAVTCLEYVWFAPLIGGNRLTPVKVRRDERLIANLIKIERDFWRLVQTRTPPAIDGSEDAAKVLKMLYPESRGESVVIDRSLYDSLKQARQGLIDAEQAVRGIENQIKSLMETADYALVTGEAKPVVTWRNSVSRVLDVNALEVGEPEVYSKYLKERTSRRFLVK